MHILTIDEVIKNQRKLAEEFRQFRNIGGAFKEQAKKQIREYDQLAEWLEELQMYKSLAPRELVSQKQRNDRNAEYHKGFNDGYNKAVEKFIDALEYDFGTDDEVVIEMYDLREAAKQLKENIC